MNKTEVTILALPEPAWHTADLEDTANRSPFWKRLATMTDEQLVTMRSQQQQWMDFHFAWVEGRLCTRRPSGLYTVAEHNARHDHAERVAYWIDCEIIERFERAVAKRKTAARKAAWTRSMRRAA